MDKKMNYDIIIIGAGLGGLTAGAFLAKKGKQVLVLEQHSIPGGAATIFKRNGIRCEVGLHEMDWGPKKNNIKAIIFQNLGILEKIPFVSLPQVWRIKTETKEYTIPEGYSNVIQYLKSEFPLESKGIDNYFKDMIRTCTHNERLPSDMNLLQFFLFPFVKLPHILINLFNQANTGWRLDKYFRNNELKNILDVNLAYYGDDPYKLSWYFHASAQQVYYNKSLYIKGGSQELSNILVEVIEKNGGEVRCLADVQKINVQANKATGVTYNDLKNKKVISVSAKKIIANCAPDNIYNGNMVPKQFNEPKTSGLKPASSLYTIYIIFKNKLSNLYPNMAYSTFFYRDMELTAPLANIGSICKSNEIKDRPFVFVNYDAIDSGLIPEGDSRSFAVFCGVSNLNEWEFLSQEDYKTKKELLAQTLFKRLEEQYSGITNEVESYEVSTPKTIQRYLRTPNGTAYGYANTNFLLRRNGWNFLSARSPRESTKIKNLYFAGAWTYPGGGFTGAIISGYMTATDLLIPFFVRILIGTVLSTAIGITLSKVIHMFFF